MNNLLDNDKVRKYFGDDSYINEEYFGDMSYSIIKSMQQPIKAGERVLILDVEWGVQDTVMAFDNDGFHFDVLRLPDRFQKKQCSGKEKYTCIYCGNELVHKPAPEARATCPMCNPLPCPIGGHMPEPEKCGCGGCNCHSGVCHSHCPNCKPSSAVEEKIRTLQYEWAPEIGMDTRFTIQLRELVKLAQGVKGECL